MIDITKLRKLPYPPLKYTVQETILYYVTQFAEEHMPFSINDITRCVRLTTHKSSTQGDIKFIFSDLCRNGAFDRVLTVSDKFNGVYYEYTATLNPIAMKPAISKSFPMEIQKRVITYLNNCSERPTLKAIQSAIKRKNIETVSCLDLHGIINNMGYSIDTKSKLSQSLVII